LNFNILTNNSEHFRIFSNNDRALKNAHTNTKISNNPLLFDMTSNGLAIFELPGDISAAILSSWIDLQTLEKLDQTLRCASEASLRFLALIESSSFVADTVYVESSLFRNDVLLHLEWLIKRQVRVRNWIVDGKLEESCLPLLKKCIAGPHVQTLHVCSLAAKQVHVISAFAAACSGLRKLNTEDCGHRQILKSLSASARQSLCELIVAGRGWESGGGESSGQLPEFPNLRKLYIRWLCGMNAPQSVTDLLTIAPNVTDLRLRCSSLCPMNDECLNVLISRAAALEILELDIERQEFTSAAVISLAERCSNLTTLALTCSDAVNDAAVDEFAHNCLQLEGLLLWGMFTAASLLAVSAHCGTRLRYLSLGMQNCRTVTQPV
jgi:hypothetical protein